MSLEAPSAQRHHISFIGNCSQFKPFISVCSQRCHRYVLLIMILMTFFLVPQVGSKIARHSNLYNVLADFTWPCQLITIWQGHRYCLGSAAKPYRVWHGPGPSLRDGKSDLRGHNANPAAAFPKAPHQQFQRSGGRTASRNGSKLA